MLHYIKIRNFALVEEAVLEFGPGFTVVTGETGAGKSVLLGALSFLAGNRFDKTVIHTGAEAAEVEATLHAPSHVHSVLESLDLNPCEEECLVLKRILHRDKPPRIFVNGSVTTLANLATLGRTWIDFHGPGEPQKLLDPAYQLHILDSFGPKKLQGLLRDYSASYAEWKDLKRAHHSLLHEETWNADEQAFWQAQVDALSALNLSESSIVQLESDFTRVSYAQDFEEHCQAVSAILIGEDSVANQLRTALKAAQAVTKIDPLLSSLGDRLQSMLLECEDIGETYQTAVDSAQVDPATLQELQVKMEVWQAAKRKYGPDMQSVFERVQGIRDKLARQGTLEYQLHALAEKIQSAHTALQTLGAAITHERQVLARTLSQQVVQVLKRLGFAHPRIEFKVIDEPEVTPHGTSHCEILFAANPGQACMPLSRIASSGEMARVMLALKTILAKADATALLVFDEVDANIGGEIGAEVGKELALLAQNHQVLCVTHLPQVACQGTAHLLVTKLQTKTSTAVRIQPIHGSYTDREQELARMLGDRASPVALQHAADLLRG